MKLSLRKVAVGATITGISFLSIRKMFHVKRPIIGISDIKAPKENYRFSHQYPEPGQNVERPSVNSSLSTMQPVSEDHFVEEEQNKTRSLTKSFDHTGSEM